MSLRNFHLVFVALSVILAVFMAAWAVGQYQTHSAWTYLATAAVCFACAAALGVYGARFQRKTKQLA